MKRKLWIVILIVIVVLGVLAIPFRIGTYDVFKPIDGLWAREEPNVEHRFIATVIELNGNTALVEPMEQEWERSSSSRISFGINELPDIGAEVGSLVQVTYRGAIRESYPASIDATGWEIVED